MRDKDKIEKIVYIGYLYNNLFMILYIRLTNFNWQSSSLDSQESGSPRESEKSENSRK